MPPSYPTETTFNVQRRMADWHFAKATTWAELLAVHDQSYPGRTPLPRDRPRCYAPHAVAPGSQS